MAVENEEMSLAVCNLLQAIIDSLSGEDKREHQGKEAALVLGRRRSSVLVPEVGGKGESVTTSAWEFPVCGGCLLLVSYLQYFLMIKITEV